MDSITTRDQEDDRIGKEIVDSAFTIHKTFGPGLLEHPYEVFMKMELEHRNFNVKNQLELPVTYRNKKVDLGFRLDLLVNDSVIIELKTVETILPVHKAQLMTYMKLMDKRLGYLINFKTPLIKNGIQRVVMRKS